jgi:hypothetical protein
VHPTADNDNNDSNGGVGYGRRAEDHDELVVQPVRADDAAGLVAVYRQAVNMAAELRAGLDAVGLGGEVVDIVPGLDEQGRPCVRPVLTLAGMIGLADMLLTAHATGALAAGLAADLPAGLVEPVAEPDHPPDPGSGKPPHRAA